MLTLSIVIRSAALEELKTETETEREHHGAGAQPSDSHMLTVYAVGRTRAPGWVFSLNSEALGLHEVSAKEMTLPFLYTPL